jgi:hypothetical protein
MQRKVATLTVTINLDPVPGTMHTEESAQEVIFSILNSQLGHYNPVVSIAPETNCGHPFYMYTKGGSAACGEFNCNNYIH